MTTIQTIQSLKEFATSTRSSGSLFLTPNQSSTIATDDTKQTVAIVCDRPLLSSVALEGKISRSMAKQQRELLDPAYRERANAARKLLAEEYSHVMPESIATLRLRLGMSQQDLANQMGTSQPHIAKIEAGRIRLYLETAGRLADALQISLDHLRQLIAVEQPVKPTVGPEL